jgi:cysteinyl-tRNA synthetase
LGVLVEPAPIPFDTLPDAIKKLVLEREAARQNKAWETADDLRKKIADKGYSVTDNVNGPVVRDISQ